MSISEQEDNRIKGAVVLLSKILDVKDKFNNFTDKLESIGTILKAIKTLKYFDLIGSQFSYILDGFEKWSDALEEINNFLGKINDALEVLEVFRDFVEQHEKLYELEYLIRDLQVAEWIFADHDLTYRLNSAVQADN
ncbi:MAG: hypothetical protein GF364_14265, partial [Candidatus Lokiarchaeota archaeon]|nr:hypothetical protein [Candidatus Lokiarchaeota archaeon]